MRFTIAIAAALAVSAAAAQEVVVRGSGGWGLDAPLNRMFDREFMVKFSGKVTGKQTSPPLPNMEPAVSLLVRADNGGTALVHLGPAWFITRQPQTIGLGERITVFGSKTFIDGKSAILATRIVVDNQTLYLRDENGMPFWSAWREAVPPNLVQIGTEVVDAKIVDVGQLPGATGGPNSLLIVQGDSGEFRVDLGPVWFMNRQDDFFNTGDVIRISGVRGNVGLPGPPIIIPNFIQRGPDVLILRNVNGQPVWLGWR